MCCRDDTIVHIVEISRVISGASLSSKCSHGEQQRGREHCGLTLNCKLSSFSKRNSISCNTAFMPLAFNVIKYVASVSEDIYFHFYL